MIQKLFSLYNKPDENCKMHLEVGEQHIACWCTDGKEALQAFEYFIPLSTEESHDFANFFKEVKPRSILLNNHFPSSEVIWENDCFTLIPKSLFTESSLLDYLTEAASDTTNKTHMYCEANNRVIAYSADKQAMQLIEQQLQDASHSHKFYKLSKKIVRSEPDYVLLVFYHRHFLVLAVKNKVLQLATSFQYQTPQDVLYHVLNTLDKLNMPATEIPVILSGFIDESSVLYKELYQYIEHLAFAESGSINKNYPAHYFTPFYT